MDIYLKKASMHIIDRETGNPVYSQKELDLTKEYVREYVIRKIQKLSSSQAKTGVLEGNSEFALLSQQTEKDFLQACEKIVTRWYDAYKESEEAPSADVFVALFEKDTKIYLAFLKVNYQEGYTHVVGTDGHGLKNDLVLQRTLLPNKTQKADEGIVVDLENLKYEIVEKKYPFSGEKRYYFSTRVIESQPAPSLEENVKVIKQVAEKIGARFENQKHDVISDVKEAVYEAVEESGQIDAKVVAQKVFKDNISAQKDFQEQIIEKGYINHVPVPKEARENIEKKYGKQKLKLSNGIELTVPVTVYRNPDLIEFINNPDGTISVSIKNVEEVISRI